MNGVLRIPAFRIQFIAHAVSVAGSTLSPVALSLGVLDATGSTTALGLTLAAYSVPMVGFMLVGGVWADRLPRHRIIVTAQIVAAASQLGLGGLLATGPFPLGIAMVLQAVTGTALAFYYPAAVGLTALTLPAAKLQQGNALLSLARSIAGSLGPLLAGALVMAVGAGWALMLDGLSFAGSAWLMSRLRLSTLPERKARSDGFLVELRQGFRAVISRSWVWTSIGAFMVSHLAMAFLFVLGPAVLLRRGDGGMWWAGVVAALSVGQLAGDVVALRVRVRRPILTARLVELLAVGLLVALACDAPVWVLLIGGVATGVAMTFPDALYLTALQQHLPEDSLSKVSSFDQFGSLALRPLGYLVAAGFAAAIGTTETFLLAAVLIALSRTAGLAFRDVRRLPSLQPAPEKELVK